MPERFLVFIPAYNCEKQVPRVLNQLLDRQVAAMVTECIVVNNRSTDGTEAAVQSWMQAHPQAPVRLLRNDQNYGLGGSHKVAFQYAVQHNFDYLIVLHGDDQGDIRDVLPLVHSGRHRKYDCCLGSRFMPESRIKGYSTLRVVGNYGFNWLFSLVAGHKITDLGSGLNLYAVHDPGPLPPQAESPFLPHQLAGGRPGIQQQTDQLWRQPAQTVRALPEKQKRVCDPRMAGKTNRRIYKHHHCFQSVKGDVDYEGSGNGCCRVYRRPAYACIVEKRPYRHWCG